MRDREVADGQRSVLGLSVGATNLAAVTAERAVTRKPVLSLRAGREPEVGTPPEDSQAHESGLVITDFIGLVGDPDQVVATDGSTHRGETLAAEALRALSYTATGGSRLPEAVAVTHPAHWNPAAVEALRTALNRMPEWSARAESMSLLSDAAAALAALQVKPGLPSRGIIAVCDFGGSGSSCTLVDADNGYRLVAPTVRYADFSGDRIDKALVAHVIEELSRRGSFDTSATSALGSLTQLRAACRDAKEALSSSQTAPISVDLPGTGGDIGLTRTELDDIIGRQLDGFCSAVQETIHNSGIRAADVAAVASIGGGASIPAVTRTLVDHLHVPVITMPRPDLSAAIGAALHAARGSTSNETAMAPAAPAAEETSLAEAAPGSGFIPALAWSEAVDDDSGIMPVTTDEHLAMPPEVEDGSDAGWGDEPEPEAEPEADWYRWPVVLVVAVTLLALAIAVAIMIVKRHPGEEPNVPTPSETSTPTTSSETSSETPSATTETSETNPPPAPPPPPETTQPPPPPETTQPPPETTTQPPPPPETTTQPPPETTTQPPPQTTTQPPTTRAPRTSEPSYPRYPTSRAPERPKNPFTPRNPFEPRNPFTPRNPWFPGF
jgi:actin-like ATPase involved in cell morphogenesis